MKFLKENMKYYLLSFLAVSLISFIIVYLQDLKIIPQNVVTGPFYYKFKDKSEFIKKLSMMTLFLYLIPVGIKYKKEKK